MRTHKIIAVILLIALALSTGVIPAAAQEGNPRPVLANEEQAGSQHFLVHYTRTGDDAVPPDDVDGSGVPDYVEDVLDALEYSWQIEVDTMGWAAPPPDNGRGGDDRIDVYLANILTTDEVYGYAAPDLASGIDNPNTPERERRATSTFLLLDNDYQEDPKYSAIPDGPDQIMRATVAHEFNHVLQAGYDFASQHFWLFESTASWAEEQVYDDVNDSANYIPQRFAEPYLCWVDETVWYADWLFIEMLSEQYGPQAVLSIWDQMRQQDGYAAIDAALNDSNNTFVGAVASFSLANLLRAYEEGADYPTVALTDILDFGTYTPSTGAQSLGADYYQISASGVAAVSLENADPSLQLIVVGIRGAEADVLDSSDGSVPVIDTSGYDYAYAIVFNSSLAHPGEDCPASSYTLDIYTPDSADLSLVFTYSAANFAPPGGENSAPENAPPPITGAAFQSNVDRPDPDELDVPFVPIIPDVLPDGYSFDYAYTMTSEDFDDLADFYVPGGDIAANYDYLTADGYWISIAESVSPYATLDEWLTDIEYDTPGEFYDIDGISVLSEDLSDEEGPWYSLTFIIDDLFIVVDTTDSEDAAFELASVLINNSGQAVEIEEPDFAQSEEDETDFQEPTDDGDLFPTLFTGISALCIGLVCLLLIVGAVVGVVIIRRRRRSAEAQSPDA